MASSFAKAYVFLKQRYAVTAKPITILFLVIMVAILTLVANGIVRDHVNKAYLRDHGIGTYGVVTRHYAESGSRSTSYYVDYEYTPLARLSTRGPIFAERREVLRDNYDLYQVGDHIPTKYDPRDIYNTHLNVRGYWTDGQLALSAFLTLLLFGIALSTAMIFPWLLVGWLYGHVFTRPRPEGLHS